jgi:hypothetical protein
VKRVAAVLLALCLAASGCGSTGPAPAACQSPAEAVMPGVAGTLDETSTGTYCVSTGQILDVFLHASTPANRWTPIASSQPDVLAPQRTGVLTAPVGVTPGIFAAMRAGSAQLSSSQPNGPSWSVTVIVR